MSKIFHFLPVLTLRKHCVRIVQNFQSVYVYVVFASYCTSKFSPPLPTSQQYYNIHLYFTIKW